jgi:hypothetical protein
MLELRNRQMKKQRKKMPEDAPERCTLCLKPAPREWCWIGNPEPGCPLHMPPRWEVDKGWNLL